MQQENLDLLDYPVFVCFGTCTNQLSTLIGCLILAPAELQIIFLLSAKLSCNEGYFFNECCLITAYHTQTESTQKQ